MNDNFKPPIISRDTSELLLIVGSPEKWNADAVQLAQHELAARNVPSIKKETAKYLSDKRERINKEIRANEGFEVQDFVLKPFRTLFIIIFSWELKKDGFDRKAKQQKYIRTIIVMAIALSFIFNVWF